MNLNLTYLKYFYDAARYESITASAKENFVTQSAISQGIMKLENFFQKKLLTHRRNSIKVTPEGQILFESSKRIFRCVDEVKGSLDSMHTTYTGKVEFACYHSVAVSLLPKPLAKFQELAPQVKPSFLIGRPELIMNWLKQGKVELGILSDNQDLISFDHESLYSGFFGVYQSKERPLKKPIDKCIFTESGPEIYSLKESYRKNYGKELESQMEVSSWEVLVNLVLANMGVGLFPDYLAKVPYREPLLRLCKLKYDPIPYSLYAVFPKGEELSKNAQLLLKCFKDTYPVN